MIYIDVDTAVTVPVNIMPLTDDTDFKSREVSIAYNATGMDLVWNFVTPNGTITQTAVTPTTAGDYDWSHVGDGMYKIEIPASGGASINNDTEGVGYFTGVCDGVLPWRGPDIVFRAAGLNDALIESAYSATRGLAGTALPAAAADAAGGLPISDAGGLDLDARLDAAISSRLAPTTAGRTLDITAGGAAGIDWGNVENPTTSVDLSATAISLCDTVTTNTDMRGTDSAFLASSAPTNFSDLAITVTTGLVSVGANNDKTGYALSSSGMDSVTLPANIITATSIANDAITAAKIAADAIGASELAADAVTEIQSGLATAAKLLAYIQLLARSDAAIGTDNSTELGEINADGGSGAGDYSNQTDAVEAIADSGGGGPTAAQIADAVWDEATSGHTTSGTFGEQVATDIDAILVDTAEIGAAGAGLTEAGGTGDQFTALPDVTLADGVEHGGTTATFVGQSLTLSNASGSAVLLASSHASDPVLDFDASGLANSAIRAQSSGASTVTVEASVGSGLSITGGTGAPAVFYNGILGTHGLLVYGGSGAAASLTGLSGTTGLNIKQLSGSLATGISFGTISGDDISGSLSSVTGTVGGIAGTITTLDALDTAQDSQHATTQGLLPASLINGRMDSTVSAINDNTAAAVRLALSAGVIIPGTVDTVTNGHTPTTVEFQADDITEATSDHYNGRVIIFTSGNLIGQATSISDYSLVGGIGQFTVVAMTEAPTNNDTFIIV